MCSYVCSHVFLCLFTSFIIKYLLAKSKTTLNNLSISIIAWILNYFVIEFFFNYGINKNLTAILIIPILVYFSFLSQKYYVFK